MSITIIQRMLLFVAGFVSLIFLFFVLSGIPGFYDPYKLDGKGIDPHKYLCDNFRREPSQCEGSIYWKQIIPVAAIKTILIVTLPMRMLIRVFER